MPLIDCNQRMEETTLLTCLLNDGEGLEIEYERCRDLPHEDTQPSPSGRSAA